MLARLDEEQQQLIASIETGQSYTSLHEAMLRRLGQVLADHGLVSCSAEAAFEEQLVDRFLPHGLGHLLGLQTHDVGGLLADPEGTPAPAPERYPALRLTRTLEEEQVFTVEPGLYFIDVLLEQLAAAPEGRLVDWPTVDRLRPYGGIRIEDNVRVLGPRRRKPDA